MNGADVHSENEYPLKQCIISKSIANCKILINYGADIGKIDQCDIVDSIILSANPDFLEFIVNMGFDFSALSIDKFFNNVDDKTLFIKSQQMIDTKINRQILETLLLYRLYITI